MVHIEDLQRVNYLVQELVCTTGSALNNYWSYFVWGIITDGCF